MINKSKIILVLYLSFCFFACKQNSNPINEGQVTIVSTTGMIADMIKNIVKEKAIVSSLMGPGVDPHLYKATQGDLKLLQAADLIVYNGLHLEGKMTEILENLSNIKNVEAISNHITQDSILSDPQHPSSPDPHIWFDVKLWSSAIDGILPVLINLDTSQKEYFTSNALAYKKTLHNLDAEVKSTLESIPHEQRILITAHDAFKYYGHAYNIEVRGLQGISTLSEFGLKDRVDLVDFIVKRKIHAVFVESSVSQKNIMAIVEGCKQKGHNIIIGDSLFSDAMGAENTPEGSYIGMVRSNTHSIVNGLTNKKE